MEETNQIDKGKRKIELQKLTAILSLVIMIVFFTIMRPNFISSSNIFSIILATCVNGILALGATFVIITGGIDLSLGANMTFSAVIAGISITKWGFPVFLGVLVGVLVGAVVGMLNGLVISMMKLPPFIGTMGVQMVLKGLSLFLTGAVPIYFSAYPVYNKIALGSILGIPMFYNAILIFLGMIVIAWILLSKTIVGRYAYALGSNEEATRLSGIRSKNWKILIYSITGAFCGVAGIVMSSRLTSAQPGLGVGYETEAIAAAVIGGASLSGGEGRIPGTVIGAFIMSVLTNGLRIMSVKQEVQSVFVGLVLILAVYMDTMRRQRASLAN